MYPGANGTPTEIGQWLRATPAGSRTSMVSCAPVDALCVELPARAQLQPSTRPTSISNKRTAMTADQLTHPRLSNVATTER
jgi:hypothetical protein